MATTPSAVATGRYGAMPGTSRSATENGRYESTSSASAWMPTNDHVSKAREAVHVFDREPRPAAEAGAARHEEPEGDRRREQREGDHAARASDVPGDVHAATGSAAIAKRQAPFSSTTSSTRNRPGSPRSSSHAGPSRERRKAALAAMSAARHEEAATDTSSQHDLAGRPVRGSMR